MLRLPLFSGVCVRFAYGGECSYRYGGDKCNKGNGIKQGMRGIGVSGLPKENVCRRYGCDVRPKPMARHAGGNGEGEKVFRFLRNVCRAFSCEFWHTFPFASEGSRRAVRFRLPLYYRPFWGFTL